MTTVAILGATSVLGQSIITALTTKFADKIKFPIIASSRSIEGRESTDKIKYVEAKLSEESFESDVKHFQGVDVIVELIGYPNPAGFKAVEKIVTQVKPKLFIPSEFGCETSKVEKLFPGALRPKVIHSKTTRDAGVKTVDVITSFFFHPKSYLYEGVGHAGIDIEKKTVFYRGDPDFKFAVTSVTDIGNSVASLITYGDYKSLPDDVKIYSDLISLRHVAERYEKDHNVTLKVIGRETKKEALEAGQKLYAAGQIKDFLYLLNVVISQGEGNGAAYRESHSRELVNPGNKYWTWSKY